MNRREFEAIVRDALEDLPSEFIRFLENVAVVVEEEPDPEELARLGLNADEEELFGLYVGTPLTEREVTSYPVLPDRVFIYRGPILRCCSSREEMETEIRDTVIHELGHHMGLSDEEMPY